MQIDKVINTINTKSTFRIIAFLILSFPTFQNYSQFQNILFASLTPNYTCQSRESHQHLFVSKDQCSKIVNGSTEPCTTWKFSPEPVGKTMVSDFKLVCDKSSFPDLILILWYATCITNPITGWLSDKYGRKRITISYLILETVSSIMISFSSNVYENIIWRILLGISASGVSISYVWLLESVNGKFRNFTGSFFWMYGCIAYMLAPFIIYYSQNWRTTQLLSIVPSCLYLFMFFIPESPRWLLTSDQRNKGFESIKTIAQWNNIRITFKKEDIIAIHDRREADLLSAWRSPVFRYRSLMAVLLQMSSSLFYSAVTINMTILSKNIYMSTFLLGLMETPSLVVSFFTLHHFSRKTNLLLFGGIGSCLFLISILFDETIFWESVVRIILGCVAKTAICCVSQTTMIYVAELFPTSHRSYGLVCSQLFNVVSFTGALYINKLSSTYFFLPMTIYVAFTISSSLLAYCTLPETKDLPFPETLQDQNMLQLKFENEYLKYMRSKYRQKDQFEDGESLLGQGGSIWE